MYMYSTTASTARMVVFRSHFVAPRPAGVRMQVQAARACMLQHRIGVQRHVLVTSKIGPVKSRMVTNESAILAFRIF